jgi:hypothetical protein
MITLISSPKQHLPKDMQHSVFKTCYICQFSNQLFCKFDFFSRSKRKRSNDGILVHASQQPASKKSKRTTSDPITMTDDDIKDMLEMSENKVIY